jgi:hypothetical protein
MSHLIDCNIPTIIPSVIMLNVDIMCCYGQSDVYVVYLGRSYGVPREVPNGNVVMFY